jgi:hypothetical protein
MAMIAPWMLRRVMTGFAVVATLAVAGRAAPAETVNGVVFVPPPAEWRFAADPGGWSAYHFTHGEGDFCEVLIYTRPRSIPEGAFRAWFDQSSHELWDKYRERFGGSDEILMNVLQGTARDGSEILSIDKFIDTYTVQINFRMVAAKKNGVVAAVFVSVSSPSWLHCWSAADNTMESIGGGYDLHNIPITEEKVDKEDTDMSLVREQCEEGCTGRWMSCSAASSSSVGDSSCGIEMTQCKLNCQIWRDR